MDEFTHDPEQSNVSLFLQTYKVPILLGSVSICCIIVALVLLVKSTQDITPIQFSNTDEGLISGTLGTQSANFKAILVDIEGAVLKPGIVSLAQGSRVEDAIVAAGGLTNKADEQYIAKNINRAMKIVDGMKLYVPTKDETSYNRDRTTSQGDVVQSYGIVATSGKPSQTTVYTSINLASKDQLDLLPGVGPVTAQKIIDNRPYQALEDLVAKKAIGPSLFEKLKNMLSL